MKKLFSVLAVSIILVLILASGVLAMNSVQLGYEFNGSQKVNNSTVDTDSGISLGYQYTMMTKELEYGAGIQYQLPRSLENNSKAKFNFIPVYGIVNYTFESKDYKPYVTGRLGYNVLQANDTFRTKGTSTEGGFYYAVGGGLTFDKVKTELLYSFNHGALDPKVGGNINIANRAIDLVVSYQF
jgi:hypothetical protein